MATTKPVDPSVGVPQLPPGRELHLGDDLGSVFVRELHGPPGAPTVMLLHGWTVTSDVNWFKCYEPLTSLVNVVAFDHRGHGRGLRQKEAFTLDDCADDVARVADALGIDRCIPVGYSMGGVIAQLMWRRHRDRVDGLVLCATAPYFAGSRPERLSFFGLGGLARLARFTPTQARDWITEQVYIGRKEEVWGDWAAQEVNLADWRQILEAGTEIGAFSSTTWLDDVDVPTALVITTDDEVVPVRRQTKLFDLIPHAAVFRVHGRHNAAADDIFVTQLLRSVRHVIAPTGSSTRILAENGPVT